MNKTAAQTSAAIAAIEKIPEGSIVVGHDGSTDSHRSLNAAFELAGKFGIPLVIVRAWSIDSVPSGVLVDHGIVASFADVSVKVGEFLRTETLDTVAAHPSVEVHYRTTIGQPASVLLALATEAKMLVVGSRGLGGFTSLLLGSVSEQCVRHAPCPVLVVRPTAATKKKGSSA